MKLKMKDGYELELVYSFRSNIYFEQIQGKSLDLINLTQNDILVLFFCVVTASLQKVKKPIITMLDFMDVIDDNNGEKAILDFSNWYIEQLQAQYSVLNDLNEEKEVKGDEVTGNAKVVSGKKNMT